MEPEFEKTVCIDQVTNWDALQKMLKERPAELKLVEEVVFAAGGVLMEVAGERSFTLPWRIDATKTTESIYSIELSGTLNVLHPRVLLDTENDYELPITVVLTDSEGRSAKLFVTPPFEPRPN